MTEQSPIHGQLKGDGRPPPSPITPALSEAIGLFQDGDRKAAARALDIIVAEDPENETALHVRGVIAMQDREYEKSIRLHRRAVARAKNRPDYYNALGAAFLGAKRPRKAIAAFEKAIEISPNYGDAHFNLGCAYHDLGEHQNAINAYATALKENPKNYSIYNNLSDVLRKTGHVNDAIACLRKILDSDPLNVNALRNLARAYREQHQMARSLKCFDLALKLDPGHADTEFGRARTLLFLGDYIEGFEAYESRWKLPDCPPRNYSQPVWDGSEDKDLTVLLHHEQGAGDTLQFVRFARLAKERVGRVIVEAPTHLMKLLLSADGVDQVVTSAGDVDFDVYAPLGSLPRILKTTVETIPTNIPYLRADPRLTAKMAEQMRGKGLRVGLCWAGNPMQPADRNRSTTLETLAPLFEVENATFYILQMGPGRKSMADAPSDLKFVDMAPHIRDFADTAAIIENLDLVLTVCTSVCHLAGGMGRPVWTMLSKLPDWRWFVDRADSPWYPTMRLFRQQRFGHWDDVIRQIKPELAALAQTASR